jgi:hypothetical protein
LDIKPILAIIIGIVLFISDLVFGWLTAISGPVPVIFIIAIIIGIVAGGVGYALLCTLISWILGLLIGTLIAPYVLVEIISPSDTFLSIFLKVLIWSIRGLFAFTYEGNLVEIIVVNFLTLVVMLIIAPVVYVFSFIFSALGGFIGVVLLDNRRKPKAPATTSPSEVPGQLQ